VGRGFRIDGGPLPELDQHDPAGLEVLRRCPFDMWERALRNLELHRGSAGHGRVLTIHIGLSNRGEPTVLGSGVVPPREWAREVE